MLTRIQLLFPKNRPSEVEFFASLKDLFSRVPNAQVDDSEIVLKATSPLHASPEVSMSIVELQKPTVKFTFDSEYKDAINISSQSDTTDDDHHQRGVPFASLVEKISQHIRRVDHLGVNIPTTTLTKTTWEKYIHDLALTTTLYRYPTGEAWPFILPATQAEFESDIHDFCLGREPKFELVYDQYTSSLVFQFDVELGLSKKEVEALFPDPVGISFEGLENVFRSVYVQSPWNGYEMRFDLRFQNDIDLDWKTGKWLVEEGGRM